MRATGLLAALIAILSTAAAAQDPSQRVLMNEKMFGPADRRDGSVRVQTTINFFLPGPTGEGEDAVKIRDRARRNIYQLAGRECDLVREVLAKDCRLEAVNVSINRQFGQSAEGYLTNGSMTLIITLKEKN